MAGVTGLEPAASGVTGRRSNQLSYTPKLLGLPETLQECIAPDVNIGIKRPVRAVKHLGAKKRKIQD